MGGSILMVNIDDTKLWAGLNNPKLEPKEADVVIFGIPYDGSVSFRSGAKEAPDALRNITYTITPTTEEFKSFENLKLRDMGNAQGETRDELFKNAEELTKKLVEEGTFFIMIGGDHSVTIPVQSGIDKAIDEAFGIVHIDAHFDLCDNMDGDKLSHGSTQRRALELKNINGIKDISFLGIRSAEMDEINFIKNNDVQVISSKEISKIGAIETVERVKKQLGHLNKIYLTIDIDCLDPAYAAGTGTPQFGGLTSRELLTILEGLFDLPIIGADIVEVAPSLDPALTSLFAARKLVTEICGHIYEKKYKGQ